MQSDFDSIVEQYAGPIIGYARRLTQSQADAEDIAQETFVRLHENFDKLSQEESLKPWLFKVCTNLCRNHAKKKSSLSFSQLESDDEDSSFVESIASEEQTTAEKMDIEVSQKEVRAALELLPPQYQAVISLYYFEHLSYEEIASTLSVPVNTVRTHLSRAKSKLATSLREKN